MILEIGKYERNAFYFDCFLSGYDREREYLFIGGFAAIKIKNVLHFMNNDEISSYSEYLQTLQTFFAILQSELVEDDLQIDLDKNKIIQSLIDNQYKRNIADQTIPSYIYKLFMFKCSGIRQIEMDLMEYKQKFTVCMNDSNTMIDINLLSRVFWKLRSIQVFVPNTFTFDREIMQYLYRNLSSFAIRESLTFEKIEFCYPSKFIPKSVRYQIASVLYSRFKYIGWFILIDTNIDDDESIYFIKVAVQFTNYDELHPTDQIQQAYVSTIPDATNKPVDTTVRYVDDDTADDEEIKYDPEASVKDLKLRIINEPLKYEGKRKCADCCLCCKDLADPLSVEEKVIKLTVGFVRVFSKHEIPSVIYSLCIDYVGDSTGFHWKQLMSNKERRQQKREECYDAVADGCDTFCESIGCYDCYCCRDCYCCCDLSDFEEFSTLFWIFPAHSTDSKCWKWIVIFMKILFFIAFFIGKDVAALLINTKYDCNKTIEGGGMIKYVPFDVDLWLTIGPIVHLVGIVLCYGAILGYVMSVLIYFLSVTMYGCLLVVATCWMVIGYLMHEQMNGYDECRYMVLSWCIIQTMETVLGPLFLLTIIAPLEYDRDILYSHEFGEDSANNMYNIYS